MDHTPEEQNPMAGRPAADHSSRLEAIDQAQRRQEAADKTQNTTSDDTVFSQPIVEALSPKDADQPAPIITQEEIEYEESPRINWTAVICTAIVAASITVILCVAQPWNRHGGAAQEMVAAADTSRTVPDESLTMDETNPSDNQEVTLVEPTEPVEPHLVTAENTPADVTAQEIEKEEQVVKPTVETLPVERITVTGTSNPYNSIRLIDASSRPLTKSEVEQMTRAELALARNAIYARHGYQFNNPELREFFSHQKWFKASDVKREDIPFTKTELDNIRLIQAQEHK